MRAMAVVLSTILTWNVADAARAGRGNIEIASAHEPFRWDHAENARRLPASDAVGAPAMTFCAEVAALRASDADSQGADGDAQDRLRDATFLLCLARASGGG
jgi:hypothetical protein